MIPETVDLEIESERTYVVYDNKTGAIAHVHRIITHRGAESVTDKQAESRALELAGRFGHRAAGLRVLRADNFDPSLSQRVNLKTGQLIADKPVANRPPAKSRSRSAGRPARR